MNRRVFASIVLVLLGCSADVRNLQSRGTAVIAFGDSLTAGVGATSGADYPSRVAAMTGIEIVNAGVSGDTTDDALRRIDADVLSKNPRIVIIGLGGNDFLRQMPMSATEANLRAIVKQIQDAGAMVVLLGFRFPTFGPKYEDMYERVANDTGGLLVPDVLDGILNNPRLKSDDIHPNADGYALIAERVAGPLAKLKEKADANRFGS